MAKEFDEKYQNVRHAENKQEFDAKTGCESDGKFEDGTGGVRIGTVTH
jgi:hypothetical protein